MSINVLTEVAIQLCVCVYVCVQAQRGKGRYLKDIKILKDE